MLLINISFDLIGERYVMTFLNVLNFGDQGEFVHSYMLAIIFY